MNTNETRHPVTVAGAIREHVDRFLRINGSTHGYDRLDELVYELELALTTQAFEDSAKMMRVSKRLDSAVERASRLGFSASEFLDAWEGK